MPVALITGINGQDGSYLAEELLRLGYDVHGTHRPQSDLGLLSSFRDQLNLHQIDLGCGEEIEQLLTAIQPREVYNLAAQSSVGKSWDEPVETGNITAIGTARLLEAIRQVDKSIRFYQASSSEMFGKVIETPQTELTPFWPRSPYGVAKVYGHFITVNYRESYDMFACSGILFNHESPRRGSAFVTSKIARTVAEIKSGSANELRLGNLQAKRDWGFAGDFVKAMWKMLQADQPRDYVIGTGDVHCVGEFVECAFDYVGLDWRKFVVIDPKFFRPAEVDVVTADPTRAKEDLDWQPKYSFEQIVTMMVEAELQKIQNAQGQTQPSVINNKAA